MSDDEPEAIVAERASRASSMQAYQEPHGSQLTTVANTLCTMVGGGVLAIPLAFDHASVGIGVILVFVATLISGMTVYFLTACCDVQQEFTFRRLLERAFPNHSPERIGKAIEALIVLSNVAALVVYVKVLGESAPPVIDQLAGKSGFWSHNLVWMIGAGVISFPMSCASRLNDLFIFAALGFCAVFYIGVVIVVRFFDGSYKAPEATSLIGPDVTYFSASTQILPAFSIILGALLYQMNVPPQYAELKQRSPARMMCTACTAYLIVCTMYCSVGLLGYMTFGAAAINSSKSGGNILKLYRNDDTLMNVGRCALCLHFLCAFPIYAVVARRSLHVVLFGQSSAALKFRVIEALCLVSFIVGMATLVPGIGIVCQFTGALFGTTVACTVPSLIYARTFSRRNTDDKDDAVIDGDVNQQFVSTSVLSAARSSHVALYTSTTTQEMPFTRVSTLQRRLVPLAVLLACFGAAETVFSVVVTIVSLV